MKIIDYQQKFNFLKIEKGSKITILRGFLQKMENLTSGKIRNSKIKLNTCSKYIEHIYIYHDKELFQW